MIVGSDNFEAHEKLSMYSFNLSLYPMVLTVPCSYWSVTSKVATVARIMVVTSE